MTNTLNACMSFSVEMYRRRHWLANKLPKNNKKNKTKMISGITKQKFNIEKIKVQLEKQKEISYNFPIIHDFVSISGYEAIA